MSTAAASPGGLLPTRALFHESWKWLRKNWMRTLIFSVLSFLIAWVWNVWIMARKLEGSVAEPGSSTTATAQGKTWNGIYWLLCTTILFGLITYGREKGFRNLLREFFTPPFTFFDNLFRRPRSAIAMGCWGAALALLVGSVVSNAIAGLLGLGFLLAAPTALAIVLNNVLIRGWIGAFSAAQPRLRSNAQGIANPYAMMFGEGIGAIVAWRADGAAMPVVLAVILVVVSFVVVAGGAGKALPNPMPLIFFVAAAVVAWKVLHATPARADDGGWSECATANGDPCSQLSFFRGWWEWRKSAGADVVIRQGRVGGTFSALGCLFGCMLGGGLAAVAAAFSSSATGGLGTGAAGATPSGSGSARRRERARCCLLPRPASGGPARGSGSPLPQPSAPHGVSEAGASEASGATGATPSRTPPPSPLARRATCLPEARLPSHPRLRQEHRTASRKAPKESTVTPAHPPPTSHRRATATRGAPDVTPGSHDAGAGAPDAGAAHGIAQGTEGLHGHAGAPPADVAPTGASRSAPDVTPGHGGQPPSEVTPTGRRRVPHQMSLQRVRIGTPPMSPPDSTRAMSRRRARSAVLPT